MMTLLQLMEIISDLPNTKTRLRPHFLWQIIKFQIHLS